MNYKCLKWSNRPVGELLEEIIDYRGKTPPKSPSGIPVLTAANVKNGQILLNNVTYISQETYNKWTTRGFPKPGDILITTEAPVGEVASFPGDRTYLINRRLMALRGRKGQLDNDFLKYSLLYNGNRDRLLAVIRGSTVPRVLKTDITGLEIPIPPYEEQRTIAYILGTLDEKIELNQQMNSTLEQIAKALFKHWFIDFEFPDEDGNPYKSSGGRMVDSELGEIPEGWRVKAFSEVIDVNPTRRLFKGKVATKVSMADLNIWQSWIDSWQKEEYKSGPKFKNGDTLFARITPSLENGKTAYVNFLIEGETAFGSTEFIVFGSKVITSGPYIFCLSKSEYIRETAINAMTGTSGRQRVPNDCFDHLLICVPSGNVVKKFDDIVANLFEKIEINSRECIYLKGARDNLLPKLMSGKKRVNL